MSSRDYGAAQPYPGPGWEYRRENNMWGEPEKLSELGRDGWELICTTEDGTFMFKRKRLPIP